jgi:hypothetical protein
LLKTLFNPQNAGDNKANTSQSITIPNRTYKLADNIP